MPEKNRCVGILLLWESRKDNLQIVSSAVYNYDIWVVDTFRMYLELDDKAGLYTNGL